MEPSTGSMDSQNGSIDNGKKRPASRSPPNGLAPPKRKAMDPRHSQSGSIGSPASPATHSRLPFNQASHRDNGAIRSPDSRDAASGRSTPQHQSNTRAPPAIMTTGRMESVSNGAVTNDDENAVMSVLQEFTSNVCKHAVLESSRCEADQRLRSAQAEKEANAKNFSGFPILAETKVKIAEGAERELRRRTQALQQHNSHQRQPMNEFARLISSAGALGADHVSRDDFAQMSSRCDSLENDLKAANTKRVLLERELAAVKDFGLKTSAQAGQFPGMSRRLNTLEAHRSSVADAMAEHVKRLENVEGSAEVANHEISEVRMGLTRNYAFKGDYDRLQQRTETLHQSVISANKKINDLSNGQEKKMAKRLSDLEAATTEDGKDSVVARLKKLDLLTDNLWSQVVDEGKEPLQQRLSQAELDVLGVQAELKDIRNMDPSAPALARVESLEADVRVLQARKDPTAPDNGSLLSAEVSAVYAYIEEVRSEIFDRIDKDYEHVDQANTNREQALGEELIKQKSEAAQRLNMEAECRKAEVQRLNAEIQRKVYRDHFSTAVRGLQTENADAIRSLQTVSTTAIQDLRSEVDKCHNILATEKLSTGAFEEWTRKMEAELTSLKARSNTPGLGQRARNTPVQETPAATGYQASPAPPQTNGVHAHPQQQQQQQQQQHSEGGFNFAYLNSRSDALQRGLNQIKARVDSLTTEEVVRAMLDQLSSIYPDVKNAQTHLDALKRKTSSICEAHGNTAGEVQALRADFHAVKGEMELLRFKSTGTGSSNSPAFAELQNKFAKIDTDVSTLRDVADAIDSRVTFSDQKHDGLKVEVELIEERLGEYMAKTDAAQERHETLSRATKQLIALDKVSNASWNKWAENTDAKLEAHKEFREAVEKKTEKRAEKEANK